MLHRSQGFNVHLNSQAKPRIPHCHSQNRRLAKKVKCHALSTSTLSSQFSSSHKSEADSKLQPHKLPNILNHHIFNLVHKNPRKIILRPRFLDLMELLQVNTKTSLVRFVTLMVPLSLHQSLESQLSDTRKRLTCLTANFSKAVTKRFPSSPVLKRSSPAKPYSSRV